MAVRIKFDSSHNVIQPTFVLATRSGNKLGAINATNISVSDSFNSHFELNFQVYKYDNGAEDPMWNQIKDFRLVWCREWDVWFEMHVQLQDDDDTLKIVSCVSLGEAELSQVLLYGIEINTEDDIAREEYDKDNPTVLYRDDLHSSSLLHRIMEKAPHYSVKHVDSSIANIQRTFSFDGVSLYDAFQEIAEEINCIFIINSGSNKDGTIERSVSVFDLESYCLNCGTRDNFADTCPECKSTNVLHGYGEDTSIFVSTDNLADEITFETDTDSVKNCFKLEAGDELMTASVINSNPNGSAYIWFVSNEQRQDMSSELQDKLISYDDTYDYFMNTHITELPNDEAVITLSENTAQKFVVGVDVKVGDIIKFTTLYANKKNASITWKGRPDTSGIQNVGGYTFGNQIQTTLSYKMEVTSDISEININEYVNAYILKDTLTTRYNNIIDKYYSDNKSLSKIPETIVGYQNLMKAYYDTIDFYLYLHDEMMPVSTIGKTTATEQAALLSSSNISSVAVKDISTCSTATATSSVLSFVKTLIDSRYQVKTQTSNFDGENWTGSFTIKNYSDETDTAITDTIRIQITGNYEEYTKQKLEKSLSDSSDDANSIISLFKLSHENFVNEIKRYCLSNLLSFHDACQACLNILIEHGVANDDLWAGQESNLYNSLYAPYYNKLIALQDEIKVRELEILTIIGEYDSDGDLISHGVQSFLEQEKASIQDTLNFEAFLGRDLWLEFLSYRREDTYRNDNYISDGLDNKQLLNKASEFIEVAKKEIYKSSTLQHSISASLKNLLVMKEFHPIADYFCVGNWIRVAVDGVVYRLRLLSYTINFDSLDTISIEFSDVKKYADGVTDAESIMEQAASMATTYDAVTRQASQGKKSKAQIEDWVTKGLALTKMKIIDNAQNQNISWDSNGLLCREYLPITDTYSDKQLKIINRGLYLTDDNWITSKAGIGDFTFYNPITGNMEESYGVIADTLVGSFVLSEKVGIYTADGNISLDNNGLTITADSTIVDDETGELSNKMSFAIQRKELDADGNEVTRQVMYVDSDGNLVFNGSIRINSSSNEYIETLDDLCDTSRFSEQINETINNELHRLPDENIEGDTGGIYSTIEQKYDAVIAYSDSILNQYKTEIGQYLDYNSTDGLILGARSSNFRTVIDNESLRFQEKSIIDGNEQITTVAYISNQQLYIPNAVIQSSLLLGNFFFSPHEDGSVSLIWRD